MINVHYHSRIGAKMLRVEGHAGCGEKGQDLVCAASSMLFYTIVRSMREMNENNALMCDPTERSEDGFGMLIVHPKKEHDDEAERSFWTILNGYRELSENYPEAVDVIYHI